MTQAFKNEKNWTLSYYRFLLKSYHIILKLISPVGLEKTWDLEYMFQSKTYVLNGFKLSSRAVLLNFWFFPIFVVVSTVIRLIVMSY